MAAAEQKKSYQVIKQFKGLNTKANRTSIGEDEFSWIENVMPIGYANLKVVNNRSTVYTSGNVAVTFSNNVVHTSTVNVNNKDYILAFEQDGRAEYFNITDGTTGNVAVSGTFSSSGVQATQWKIDRALIIDPDKGYFTWDGNNTVAVGSVGVIGLSNVGSGYTSAPAVTIGAPNDPNGKQATAVATLVGGAVVLPELARAQSMQPFMREVAERIGERGNAARAKGIDKAATEFREHMNGWNADARHQNLLSWLASGYSSFIEDDFRILDENNPDVPLTLVLHYHGAFLLNGPRTFDYFPSLELSLLRFPEAAHRRTPVHFPHEIRVESEWTYELPDGYGWKSLSLARKLEPEYLHWRFSVQQGEPRTITLRQQWSVDPFLVDASEYRQLRTEWDPVLQHCGLRLAISRL